MADKIHDLILKQEQENAKIRQALDGKQKELEGLKREGAKDGTGKVLKLIPKVINHLTGGKGTLHAVFSEIGEALETVSRLDVNYLNEFKGSEPYGLKLDDDTKYVFNHLLTGVWSPGAKLVDVFEKICVQHRVLGNPFNEKAVKHGKK